MRGKKKENIKWDKLDNTANLFPVIATESMTNVYRLSVTLKEEVQPQILQKALEKVLPWFDVFRARLRKGVFWYYFETNQKPVPKVEPETEYPGAFISPYGNQNYLFRITYYHKRINLEVFHVLTDGMGAITFLRELVYQYLRDVHEELKEKCGDSLSSGTSLNTEDSFVKNYRKKAPRVYKSERAVHLKGEKLGKFELGVIHGYFPIEQLKKVCKSKGVTINQYLVGIFIYSIYKEYSAEIFRYPITSSVPVNLRPYFDSNTTKNFFAMVTAVFKPEKENYSSDEVVEIVAKSLKEQTTKENLNQILSYNVSNEKKLVLRMVPLFVKNIVMKQIYKTSAKANTTTVTNIGNIILKEEYVPYVERFHVVLSMSKGQNMKGAVCSYNGEMVFTISSVLKDVSVQRRFFRTIAQDGIEVKIESNGEYDE